jgi:ribonuclease HI
MTSSKARQRVARLTATLNGEPRSHVHTNPWKELEKSVDSSEFPVQAPQVRLFDINGVHAWLAGRDSPNAQAVHECIEILSGWRGEHECTVVPLGPKGVPESSLRLRFIRQLEEAGIVSNLSPEDPILSFVLVHAILEQPKSRFRVIVDALPQNVLLRDLEKVTFSSVLQLKRWFSEHEYAVSFDFRAWYYQFNLTKLRNYYVFRRGSKLFRFEKGVMGLKWMVKLAHDVTKSLAQEVALSVGVTVDVYIDNVLFLGTHTLVTRAAFVFMSLMRAFDVQISEYVPSTQQFTYRGLQVDLRTQEIALKPSFVSKTSERIQYVLDAGTVTKAQLESLAGAANWASVVLEKQFGLGHVYHALASTSKVSGGACSKELILTHELRDELQGVLIALPSTIGLSTTMTPSSKPVILLYTDACKDITLAGKGIVVVTPNCVKEYVEEFSMHEMMSEAIHLLEIKALIAGLKKLYPGSRVRIFCDNEGVVKAIKKGRSSEMNFHKLVKEARNLLQTFEEWEIIWIESKLNWADEPSRRKRD